MTRKNLRQDMPLITAFIDDLRAAFGAEHINPIIKSGIDGTPGFWAQEGGFQVGTQAKSAGASIPLSHMVVRRPPPARK